MLLHRFLFLDPFLVEHHVLIVVAVEKREQLQVHEYVQLLQRERIQVRVKNLKSIVLDILYFHVLRVNQIAVAFNILYGNP